MLVFRIGFLCKPYTQNTDNDFGKLNFEQYNISLDFVKMVRFETKFRAYFVSITEIRNDSVVRMIKQTICACLRGIS